MTPAAESFENGNTCATDAETKSKHVNSRWRMNIAKTSIAVGVFCQAKIRKMMGIDRQYRSCLKDFSQKLSLGI